MWGGGTRTAMNSNLPYRCLGTKLVTRRVVLAVLVYWWRRRIGMCYNRRLLILKWFPHVCGRTGCTAVFFFRRYDIPRT